MKTDELWENYCYEDRRVDGGQYMMWDNFLAALQEYGELVKAEARKVCESKSDRQRNPSPYMEGRSDGCDHCAAAIEKMKLP